ncbi:VIT1/CCC1 transporter family protein [Halalkalicoccus sp. NIPERK01]|uniref:VIT1/CCC1 transporter family protein n=1 Tax=Halalkalicoccus sp. NIPERK01 TaxID=3053469 RepID=UPI00256F539A|nr:VIT1/CCC1 transporter family protein [Halalkalicoccus sp. NIPERK01]MDL5363228.1 VIT1/CCC1 transporter family protein [Halalkalicoccus sp. NIPERK01]
MSVRDDVTRYRRNIQDEIDSATVYEAMAAAESQPQLADVYRRLAATEREHADFWVEKLREAGTDMSTPRPSWRARVLAWLARRFGPDVVAPTMRAGEAAGGAGYATQPEVEGTGMVADERSHDRLLAAIAEAPGRGAEGNVLARLEGRHRASSGNALRAAVLGANDGLVSNLSLVMGVAGAALNATAILITGLAGLLAGAGSMAMGEWLSVQSSRELYQRQIDIEAAELAEVPEEEAEELALIYEAKGLSREQAEQLAERLVADEATALDTLAREELGIDPEELGGSAWEAAGASFILFALGAIVPVIPFFAFTGLTAVGASLLLSAIALFVVGAAITVLTGRSVLYSGTRQVVIGLAAAGLTYGVGTLIGVSIAG